MFSLCWEGGSSIEPYDKAKRVMGQHVANAGGNEMCGCATSQGRKHNKSGEKVGFCPHFAVIPFSHNPERL